jgi:hypothetical protein
LEGIIRLRQMEVAETRKCFNLKYHRNQRLLANDPPSIDTETWH